MVKETINLVMFHGIGSDRPDDWWVQWADYVQVMIPSAFVKPFPVTWEQIRDSEDRNKTPFADLLGDLSAIHDPWVHEAAVMVISHAVRNAEITGAKVWVMAHSLGTVIAYRAMRDPDFYNRADWQSGISRVWEGAWEFKESEREIPPAKDFLLDSVDRFYTIGSPISKLETLGVIRRVKWPQLLGGKWINIYSPMDVVCWPPAFHVYMKPWSVWSGGEIALAENKRCFCRHAVTSYFRSRALMESLQGPLR